ncbi:hypothetical protein [Nocardioides sp. GXQ0305]|uniref:hypothetical protein n=1 Tax=Nocardioides sp. GXQ0305 TaxID=3423912 RepID=UPI003D7EBDFB
MFIQIIQGSCRRQDECRRLMDEWLADIAPGAVGWLGGTYGFTDDGQLVAVVRFESREAAMANSAREEQGAWWSRMEACFDGPVEFHDCDRVVMMLEGGSDQAGFVQVIRGRLDDPDALESGMREMETLLHEARPEIIGATFAIEPDGTFTETVAFTSEAAAREAESRTVPDSGPMHDAMASWDRMVHDLSFHDLHHPWFASKA